MTKQEAQTTAKAFSDEFPNGFPDGTKITVNGEEKIYTKDGKGAEQNPPGEDSTSKKESPKTWSGKKDARELPGAGKYPNYYSHKTRSGHVFMMDDSNGAEHLTLQHRSGTAIQFHPDGSIQLTAHNGSYEIIFGEKRMKITGSYDVAVEGAASLRVEGDYNMTVNGNMNTTVKGNMSVSSKNYNQVVTGNIDVAAQNKTEKIEGSATTQTVKGSITSIGGKAVAISSPYGSVSIGAKKTLAMKALGKMQIESLQKMSIVSQRDLAIKNEFGSMSVVAGNRLVLESERTNVQGKQGVYIVADEIKSKVPIVQTALRIFPIDPDDISDFKHEVSVLPE